ncbi:ABC transporter substrate-binding protein [Lagierella sp.]|uniref:ABC transporter substrate-binding protein n=1 Tax=Lagierella sp. TaxID=2849657 RepID=UPI002623FC3C|nr:ABC transporter substrate-binding protein [Lagierella sp.]
MKRKIFVLLIIMSLLTACNGGALAEDKKGVKNYSISISQFAQHESLNNCRNGLIEGLKEEGLIEGENLKVDYKNSDGDLAIANQIAQQMASSNTDLVVAISTPSAMASFNALLNTQIPMVYTAITDPVEAQLAKEDRSPMGNVTGTSDVLPVEAQLKTIREIMPRAKNLGILYTSSESSSVSTIRIYEELASKHGFNLISQAVTESSDIPLATDSLIEKVDVMTNILDNNVVNSLPLILDKAGEKNIPVFGSEVEQVKLGCIAAEGIDYEDLGRQTGVLAAKVLKKELDPKEAKFETFENPNLYINKASFEKLGIDLTKELEQRAVEVFE